MNEKAPVERRSSFRSLIAPLALAQFICSFAGSNMNVMISAISADLGTTVKGVQTAITLFLLVMAALMIPGGKLTDRWGRTRCLTLGLTLFGAGALLSAAAPGLGTLIVGYSILEGVGTALLIPPVYILTTLFFGDLHTRARAFGAISGMGGIGAAAGPLIGGLIATGISWRAAFIFQALVVAGIVLLARRIKDPLPPDPSRYFDTGGAILSAAGLVLVVTGILQAENSFTVMFIMIGAGALVLCGFFAHVRRWERKGKEPLLSTDLFKNRTADLALTTQTIQWMLLLGSSFVVSAFLQVERGFDAIQTGVIFTAATLGVLISSLAAGTLAKRYPQGRLISAGFAGSVIGIGVLLIMVRGSPSPWAFAPGLFLVGAGVGTMLTPSVNVVQSSFPEDRQGEISGLSRSVSNLGSSLGTAIGGTILVLGLPSPDRSYGLAMIVLAGIGAVGFVVSLFIPKAAGVPVSVNGPSSL